MYRISGLSPYHKVEEAEHDLRQAGGKWHLPIILRASPTYRAEKLSDRKELSVDLRLFDHKHTFDSDF